MRRFVFLYHRAPSLNGCPAKLAVYCLPLHGLWDAGRRSTSVKWTHRPRRGHSS